tara:strand:- start:942 stop:1994 length:1053 start_codon:yes stop_codon:yes gene_type:complete
MITRKNYELYFIDYLEGTLSDNEIAMVNVFLKENPDLEEELTQLSSISPLEPEEKVELDFSYLKKQSLIDEANEEDFFIGKIEGDLNEEQEKQLSLYLIDKPEKKAVLESFEKTILSPDVLIFPNKRSLKRTKKIGYYYYLTSGVAACILVLLYFNLNLDSTKKIPLTAQKSEYKLILDKVETSKEENQNDVVLEFEKNKITQTKRKVNLAQQIPQSKTLMPNPKEIINSREKMELDNIEQKKIETKFSTENNNELLVFNPIFEKVISESVIEKTKTIKEYAKEKLISFIEEKTTEKKGESQSLLAFLEKKAKEIPLPKFIDYDNQKSKKQNVRTIKIGNIFSVKRKTRI